jgi:hypothetical protein
MRQDGLDLRGKDEAVSVVVVIGRFLAEAVTSQKEHTTGSG